MILQATLDLLTGWPDYWLLLAIIAAGSTVQAVIGFGFAMVAAPLAALINPELIPGPVLLNGMLISLQVAFSERNFVRLGELRWSVPGRLAGTFIGIWLLSLVTSPATFSLLFGGVVIVAVLISIAGWHIQPAPASLLAAGLVSGVMGTTSSIGGPPLALLYQKQSAGRIRGSLNGFFIFGTIFSLTGLALAGRFGWHHLEAGILLWPGTIAGARLGKWLVRRYRFQNLRPAIMLFSAVTALIIIFRNLS